MNYAVVDLSSLGIADERSGYPAIDQFAGLIPTALADYDGQISGNWIVDWENRVVSCDGVNYYQGLYERLTILFRRFKIDLNDPSIAKEVFQRWLPSMDCAARICDRIFTTLSLNHIPVVVCLTESHHVPSSVFRDFAYAKNDSRFHVSMVCHTYESYVNNQSCSTGSTINAVDLTRHRECRSAVMPVRERFEAWFDANRHHGFIREKGVELASANRSRVEENKTSPVRERIARAKKAGKKIVCCLGRIVFDMCMPKEGGSAHVDMADWLLHTMEVLGGKDDFLLLVKPHPNELHPSIVLNPRENLRSLLPEELPENVIFLDHREYNTRDLDGVVDLAILWTGTAAVELILFGVPVMVCSQYGRVGLFTDMLYPESREKYAEFLRSGRYPAPSEEARERAAAFLSYIASADGAIPYPYTKTSILNQPVYNLEWNREAVDRYLRYGDPNIVELARRIVEGVGADPKLTRSALLRFRSEAPEDPAEESPGE